MMWPAIGGNIPATALPLVNPLTMGMASGTRTCTLFCPSRVSRFNFCVLASALYNLYLFLYNLLDFNEMFFEIKIKSFVRRRKKKSWHRKQKHMVLRIFLVFFFFGVVNSVLTSCEKVLHFVSVFVFFISAKYVFL